MGEVTGPVIATTLVLLAVFVPVSFMPGITGELYRQFSVTICVAVVLSSLNALTVAPALCRLLLAPDRCAPGGLPVASRGWSSARANATCRGRGCRCAADCSPWSSSVEGYSTGEAIAALERVAAGSLPEGYGVELTGTARQQQEAAGLAALIFGLAFVFAYLFLVAQYESWSVPVSVRLSVSVALLGAVLPLSLLPFFSNDMYAQIGMVLLIGLASKNAILMVEFAKAGRARGSPTQEAALQASPLRFPALLACVHRRAPAPAECRNSLQIDRPAREGLL